MRGLAACLLGVMAGACIDIPAHQAPIDAPRDAACATAGDCDNDGWPAIAINPAANDCDDLDDDINPGQLDDPATPADEDCIAAGVGDRLPRVTGTVAGLTSGDLALTFDSETRMPDDLRIAGVSALNEQVDPCLISNEEKIGVSVYPSFAAHARSPLPLGNLMIERGGPAMATAHVSWTRLIAASGVNETCMAETTLTTHIRFTVLPGGRLIRDDRINVSVPITTCRGCASFGGNSTPIFASYIALDGSFDRMAVDGSPDGDFMAQMQGTAPNLALILPPQTTHGVCLRKSGGRGQIAITWLGETGQYDDIRLRPTAPDVGRALVFDWRRGMPVGARDHWAITTVVAADAQGAGCAPDVVAPITEVRGTPAMEGLRYEPSLGVYQPIAVPDGVLSFAAVGSIARGLTVRSMGLGARGVTVWRGPDGGRATRLIRDWDYLVQPDGDAIVIHVPAITAGERLIVAGPGHEPPP